MRVYSLIIHIVSVPMVVHYTQTTTEDYLLFFGFSGNLRSAADLSLNWPLLYSWNVWQNEDVRRNEATDEVIFKRNSPDRREHFVFGVEFRRRTRRGGIDLSQLRHT